MKTVFLSIIFIASLAMSAKAAFASNNTSALLDIRIITTMAEIINLPSNNLTKIQIIKDLKKQATRFIDLAKKQNLPKELIQKMNADMQSKLSLANELPSESLKALFISDLQEIQSISSGHFSSKTKSQLLLLPIATATSILSLPAKMSFEIFS